MSIGAGTSLAFVNTENELALSLPPLQDNTSRIINVKSVGSGAQLVTLSDSTATIFGLGITFSNTFQTPNITVQANTQVQPGIGWGINQFYFATGATFEKNATPSGTTIQLDTSRTFWTVDLRFQSKVLFLPSVASVNTATSNSFLIILKDKYGYAATNPMYIGTVGGDILESPLYGGFIGIHDNYACIQLTANSTTNTWNILSYYNGSQQ